jgi:hypothetical protein
MDQDYAETLVIFGIVAKEKGLGGGHPEDFADMIIRLAKGWQEMNPPESRRQPKAVMISAFVYNCCSMFEPVR